MAIVKAITLDPATGKARPDDLPASVVQLADLPALLSTQLVGTLTLAYAQGDGTVLVDATATVGGGSYLRIGSYYFLVQDGIGPLPGGAESDCTVDLLNGPIAATIPAGTDVYFVNAALAESVLATEPRQIGTLTLPYAKGQPTVRVDVPIEETFAAGRYVEVGGHLLQLGDPLGHQDATAAVEPAGRPMPTGASFPVGAPVRFVPETLARLLIAEYTVTERIDLVEAGTDPSLIRHGGDPNKPRPNVRRATHDGYVLPTNFRDSVDELAISPPDPPVLAVVGGGPQATVGTQDWTLSIARVEFEVWKTGEAATLYDVLAQNGTAEMAVTVPDLVLEGETEYNARARCVGPEFTVLGEGPVARVRRTSYWSETVTWISDVVPDTTPPVWTPIPTVTGEPGDPDDPISLDTYASDPESGPLVYSFVGTPPAGYALSGARNETLTVGKAAAASDSAAVRATNAAGLSADTTVSRQIAPAVVETLAFSNDFATVTGVVSAPGQIPFTGTTPEIGGAVFNVTVGPAKGKGGTHGLSTNVNSGNPSTAVVYSPTGLTPADFRARFTLGGISVNVAFLGVQAAATVTNYAQAGLALYVSTGGWHIYNNGASILAATGGAALGQIGEMERRGGTLYLRVWESEGGALLSSSSVAVPAGYAPDGGHLAFGVKGTHAGVRNARVWTF